MAKLKIKDDFEEMKSLHLPDKNTIINFFNSNYKTIGTIANFGTFIDNVKIKNEYGIKADLKYIFSLHDNF